MLPILRSLDFGNSSRVLNLPDGATPQEPATVAQMNAAIEGTKWKVSVRISAPSNVNIASPGASIDGITLAANDRVLLPNQTTGSENGIYIWNGAAVVMTRALDANSFNELESAVLSVEEGTSANTTLRQTAVNGTLGVTSVTFSSFGTSAPPASTTIAGISQLATAAETLTGTDTAKVITPDALKQSGVLVKRGVPTNIGDGSATSFVITHNLNTRDVQVVAYRNSGNYDTVLAEIQRTSVNSITILFDIAPAVNAYRVLILG